MSGFCLSLLVALAVISALLVLNRRGRLNRTDSDLLEICKVSFEFGPIAIIIRHRDTFIHCNDAAVRILGARDKSQVLQSGPAKVVAERQRGGRLTADILKECMEMLKQGKTFHYDALAGHRLDSSETIYVDIYWVPATYLGSDATIVYIVDANERIRIAEGAKQHVQSLAGDFEASIGGLVKSLASTATEMRATSHDMSTIAEKTAEQASGVSSAAVQVSSNVQAAAAATEELSSSTHEIGRQVIQSAKIASYAVEEANRTSAMVQGLSAAAERIGAVVELISDVASQTNLLALNATIEAARAGNAGRGFAVVASEVKTLAGQTGKATEEISSQVAAIQAATGEVVDAIKSIGATIGSMSEIATAIAAAVEEQGSATQEIARNSQQTATSTDRMTKSMVEVTRAANEVGTTAGQAHALAEQVGTEAAALRANVDNFLTKFRAA
jgi:Methyl-accepting chemotaxis protein (MCP) signalling domain